MPIFCASLALEIDGRAVVAAVYDPNRRELFTAEAGVGSWLNGQRLKVSTNSTVLESMLVTGFPYNIHEKADDFLKVFGQVLKQARALRAQPCGRRIQRLLHPGRMAHAAGPGCAPAPWHDRPVRVERLADGLWRWIVPAPDGVERWSVYAELADGVLLVDPMLPPPESEDRARFWRALDRDVARFGGRVFVTLTRPGERLAAAEIADRYPGATIWPSG